MKLHLYLSPEGQEHFAKHGLLYPWHVSAMTPNADGTFDAPTKHYMLLETVDVQDPSRTECALNAKTALDERIASIRAEAYKAEKEVETRINDLLMIGYNKE